MPRNDRYAALHHVALPHDPVLSAWSMLTTTAIGASHPRPALPPSPGCSTPPKSIGVPASGVEAEEVRDVEAQAA